MVLAARQSIVEPVKAAGPAFENVWHDDVISIALTPAPVLLVRSTKTDRLPMPTPVLVVKPVEPEQERYVLGDFEPIKRERRHLDVCERHNMHKVYVRHGRSWRCRKHG
jgi:hypothetical protein